MCAIINIIKTVFLHVKDKNQRLQEACKTDLQIHVEPKMLFLKIVLHDDHELRNLCRGPDKQILIVSCYKTWILTKQENEDALAYIICTN